MPLYARNVMQTNVRTVPPSLPLTELEDLLISERIGGVPVVADGRVVGIVSRSDIVRLLSLDRAIASFIEDESAAVEFAPGEEVAPTPLPSVLLPHLEGRTVAEAMASDPVTVAPDAPIHEVARLLCTRHHHRVLVTEEGELKGLISTIDLIRLVAEGRLHE